MTKAAGKLIGIISDTHGLVGPEALKALEGVEMVRDGNRSNIPCMKPVRVFVDPQ